MKEEKLTFTIDPYDEAGLRKLMDKYGDDPRTFMGSNERMEDTASSIFKDHISVRTFQNNGWVRRNIYWRDGTREELYEGRWDRG